MSGHLHQELANWQALKARLKARFPDMEDDDLFDSLDGATTLAEAVEALIGQALEDETLAGAIGERQAVLAARKSRLQRRAERVREMVAAAMEEAGVRRFEFAEATVSLTRRPPSVIVTDEAAIPDAFKVPQPPKLDRRALSAALKEGREVPGAMIGNGGTSLTVRRG